MFLISVNTFLTIEKLKAHTHTHKFAIYKKILGIKLVPTFLLGGLSILLMLKSIIKFFQMHIIILYT